MISVSILLAIVAARFLQIYHMDVNNAFLPGELSEEVYMEIPQGLSHGKTQSKRFTKVWKLLKSFYGLKQASSQWNIKLTIVLVTHAYNQSKSDPSKFTRTNVRRIACLLVYVDDLLSTWSNQEMINDVKRVMLTHSKIKDFGDLRYFLGLENCTLETSDCG